jgi:hypothetical protein
MNQKDVWRWARQNRFECGDNLRSAQRKANSIQVAQVKQSMHVMVVDGIASP